MEIFVQNWLLELALFLPAMVCLAIDENRRKAGRKPLSLWLTGIATLVVFLAGLALVCGAIHLVVSPLVNFLVMPSFH